VPLTVKAIAKSNDLLRCPEPIEETGFPKFTNEVQHLIYDVSQWNENTDIFLWRSGFQLPIFEKKGDRFGKVTIRRAYKQCSISRHYVGTSDKAWKCKSPRQFSLMGRQPEQRTSFQTGPAE
jgi:hypothetical protein